MPKTTQRTSAIHHHHVFIKHHHHLHHLNSLHSSNNILINHNIIDPYGSQHRTRFLFGSSDPHPDPPGPLQPRPPFMIKQKRVGLGPAGLVRFETGPFGLLGLGPIYDANSDGCFFRRRTRRVKTKTFFRNSDAAPFSFLFFSPSLSSFPFSLDGNEAAALLPPPSTIRPETHEVGKHFATLPLL
ncbi:hypothetical protein Droror1_Dr00025538 [Drosera rotundifolia]